MIKDASDRDNEVQPNEIMATNICRNIFWITHDDDESYFYWFHNSVQHYLFWYNTFKVLFWQHVFQSNLLISVKSFL